MPYVSARDHWTEENTRMIAMCSDKKICEENRQYFHKHVRHVKRNGRDEKRASRIFLSQALIKLLTQNNMVQVDGRPYTRRLPKHFLKAAELWVARRGQRLLGWPKGLSSPNRFGMAGFPVAVVLSLSKMLLKGTIRIEQVYEGVVGQGAVSDIQLQKIHPSRDKPNMSGSLHKSKKNINKDLVPGSNRGIKGSTGADTTETLFPLPRGTVINNFSLSNMNESELLLNNAISLDSLLEESDSDSESEPGLPVNHGSPPGLSQTNRSSGSTPGQARAHVNGPRRLVTGALNVPSRTSLSNSNVPRKRKRTLNASESMNMQGRIKRIPTVAPASNHDQVSTRSISCTTSLPTSQSKRPSKKSHKTPWDVPSGRVRPNKGVKSSRAAPGRKAAPSVARTMFPLPDGLDKDVLTADSLAHLFHKYALPLI